MQSKLLMAIFHVQKSKGSRTIEISSSLSRLDAFNVWYAILGVYDRRDQ